MWLFLLIVFSILAASLYYLYRCMRMPVSDNAQNHEWQTLVAKRDDIERDVSLPESERQELREEWAGVADEVLLRQKNTAILFVSDRIALHAGKLIFIIIVVAGLLYVKLGGWRAEDAMKWPERSQNPMQITAEPPPAGGKHPGDGINLQERIAELQQKLEKSPDDLEGWVLLARTLNAQNDFAGSEKALEKALKLAPGHPDLLADLADTKAMLQDKSLAGEPLALAKQALESNPNHAKAIALVATAAMQAGQQEEAIKYWKRLRALFPKGSANLAQIDTILAQLGVKIEDETNNAALDAPTAVVSGELNLAGNLVATLKSKLNDNSVLYVFAKMPEGPPMPIAVQRLNPRDLLDGRVGFKLDDSMSMSPQFKLSATKQAVLEARVSFSGNAMRQPGDLSGRLERVSVGERHANMTINQVEP